MGYIYCVENILNKKKYIGQTSQYYINNRLSSHKVEAKNGNNKPLYEEMRQYGFENFKLKILLKNVPSDKLDFYEILWIKKFNTMNPSGYNIHPGGRQNYKKQNNPMYGKTPWNKGLKRTPEEIQKMRWSEEKKKLYSEKFKGINNPMYGKQSWNKGLKLWSEDNPNPFKDKKHTENTIIKLKEISKKLPVEIIDDNENIFKKFESIKEAARWLKENTKYKKADDSFISKCAKGKHKSAYGFKWRFTKEKERKNNGTG
jgi:group I intron endonuclease